jgi:dihydrofolate synthase/folylpolyglutamate synthase
MDYNEALGFIHGALKFGSKLGLRNITRLLNHLNNPHEKLKFIHVAGTNGKGSTCAMIAEILQNKGLKTGMYTSPYVEEFTERIQINRENIPQKRLAEITDKVKDAINIMIEKGYEHPTEFEIVTAIAFQYFFEEECEIVVLEVGLGGRYDATNVIKNPLVSVITSIGYDHMKHLGSTLEEIAHEKCGIIKENCPVVAYLYQKEEPLKVIKKYCAEKNSSLYIGNKERLYIKKERYNLAIFNYDKYKEITLNLGGIYQISNAITAIETIKVLNSNYNYGISLQNIIQGLKDVKWSGRFEIYRDNPLVIFDGGHNIEGILALNESLKKYFKNEKITLIIGMMKDKEYEKCIKLLLNISKDIISTAPNMERALDPKIIKEIVQINGGNCMCIKDPKDALNFAIKKRTHNIICCCGSLYLISELKNSFGNL